MLGSVVGMNVAYGLTSNKSRERFNDVCADNAANDDDAGADEDDFLAIVYWNGNSNKFLDFCYRLQKVLHHCLRFLLLFPTHWWMELAAESYTQTDGCPFLPPSARAANYLSWVWDRRQTSNASSQATRLALASFAATKQFVDSSQRKNT